MFRLAVTAGWGALAAAVTLAAEGAGSLSDLDVEFTETRLTLQTVVEENRALRKDLENARLTVRELTGAVAVAHGEAEVFRREAADLRLQLEALGAGAAEGSEQVLRQRLLQAVRDLEVATRDKEQLTEQLVRLNEVLIRFLPTAESSEAQVRLELETELRAAAALLGATPPELPAPGAIASTITDAMVISYKEDLSLVVANVGARNGVRLGMPFEVWRGETRVGTVRTVDVRERISGAVIQDLGSDKERIRVGDRLRVQTNQPN